MGLFHGFGISRCQVWPVCVRADVLFTGQRHEGSGTLALARIGTAGGAQASLN